MLCLLTPAPLSNFFFHGDGTRMGVLGRLAHTDRPSTPLDPASSQGTHQWMIGSGAGRTKDGERVEGSRRPTTATVKEAG